MATKPSIATLSATGKYSVNELNTIFQTLRDHFETVLGKDGTAGQNNLMSGDLDMNGFTIRNAVIDLDDIAVPGVTSVNTNEGAIVIQAGDNITLDETTPGTIIIHASVEAGTVASTSVTVTPVGNISSTNVQAAIEELDDAITAATGEINTASNVGAGSEVFKEKDGVDLVFRTIVAGTNITVTEGTDEITIDAAGSVGEANTASNVGTGVGKVFKAKSSLDLQFKSIAAGAGVTVTNGTNDVTIAVSSATEEYVNPTSSTYGAVGNDSTDNTTAFANAFTAALASKKAVVIPTGTYRCSSFDPPSGIEIVGVGGPIIKLIATTNSHLVDLSSKNSISFRNIKFDGNGTNQSAGPSDTIRLTSCYNITFDNVEAFGGRNSNLRVITSSDAAQGTKSIARNSKFHTSSQGSGVVGDRVSNIEFYDCDVYNNPQWGYIFGPTGVVTVGSSSATVALYTLSHKYIKIHRGSAHDNGFEGVAFPFAGDLTTDYVTWKPYTTSPAVPLFFQYCDVLDVNVYDNGLNGVLFHVVSGKCNDNTVVGNGTTVGHQGIVGGMVDSQANNNTVRDNTGVGVDLGAATRSTANGNTITGNGQAGLEYAACFGCTGVGNTLNANWKTDSAPAATTRGGIIVHMGATGNGVAFTRTPENILLDDNYVGPGNFQAYGISINNANASAIHLGQNNVTGTIAPYYIGSTGYVPCQFRRAALVYRTSDQSITNSTPTVIQWQNTLYNDFTIWNSGAPTRLTVPNGARYVKLNYQVDFEANSSGTRTIAILKNGAIFNGASRVDLPANASPFATRISGVSPVYEVVAGDYFELRVNQSSGSNINTVAQSGGVASTTFGLECVY